MIGNDTKKTNEKMNASRRNGKGRNSATEIRMPKDN